MIKGAPSVLQSARRQVDLVVRDIVKQYPSQQHFKRTKGRLFMQQDGSDYGRLWHDAEVKLGIS